MSDGITHSTVGSELTQSEYHTEGAHSLTSGTSFPGSPSEMDLYYRSDEHKWYVRSNTAWVDLTSQGNDLTAIGSNLIPDTDNAYDIGESGTPLEWKDAYFDGIVTTDQLKVDEHMALGSGSLNPLYTIYMDKNYTEVTDDPVGVWVDTENLATLTGSVYLTGGRYIARNKMTEGSFHAYARGVIGEAINSGAYTFNILTGAHGYAYSTGTAVTGQGSVIGVYGLAKNLGTGTIVSAAGVQGAVQLETSSGDISGGRALYGYVNITDSASGTIDIAYGADVFIRNQETGGVGEITTAYLYRGIIYQSAGAVDYTTAYGLYLDVDPAFVSGTAYGIYIADAELNIIDGDVHPLVTSTWDLGGSSNYWKDIYFSGLIKTANLSFSEENSTLWRLRDSANVNYRDLALRHLRLGNNASQIQTSNVDDRYATIMSRNTGGGLVEIARMQGATDPYFSMGGSQEFKFYNSGIATFTPTGTGTLIDFILETEWTTGTLLNADFAGATTATGDIKGIVLNFQTNLTPLVGNSDILGYQLLAPALTQTGATNTAINGFWLSAAGALEQNTGAGNINWRGLNIVMPNITETTGSIVSHGILVTMGTSADGGDSYGINIAGANDANFDNHAGLYINMAAVGDMAINVAQGDIDIAGDISVGGTVDTVDVAGFKSTYDTHDHSSADPTQVDYGDLLNIPGSFTPAAHILATSGPHSGTLPLADLAVGTQGGTIRRGAADWEEYALGTENYVLKAGATDVAWGQVAWGEVTSKPTDFNPTAHALNSAYHTGDLGYTQLDAIVDTSGTGGSALISRADHVHTDADGSSKVTYSNLSGIPGSFTPSAHVLATTGPHSGSLPVSDMNINASIIPTTLNSYDLGSAAYEWANLYIGTGRIYFHTDQGESIYSDGTNLILISGGAVAIDQGTELRFDEAATNYVYLSQTAINTLFLSTYDDNVDFSFQWGYAAGAYGYEWKYIGTGTGDTNYLELHSDGGGASTFRIMRAHLETEVLDWGVDMLPDTANTYDLGSADFEWNRLYIGTDRIYFYTDQGESIRSDGSNLIFGINTTDELVLESNQLRPNANVDLGLGTTSYRWADYYGRDINLARSANVIWTPLDLNQTNTTADFTPKANLTFSLYDHVTSTQKDAFKVIVGKTAAGASLFDSNVLFQISQNDVLTTKLELKDIQITAYDDIRPSAANSWDLGNPTYEWKDLYLYGTLYFTANQGETIRGTATPEMIFAIGGTDELILSATALYPNAASGLNLGTTAKEYGNVYIGAGRYYMSIDQGESIRGSSDTMIIGVAGADELVLTASELRPNADAGLNLGTTSQRYGTIYADNLTLTNPYYPTIRDSQKNQQLTTTTETEICAYTVDATDRIMRVAVFFRVVTATTTVTVKIYYTNAAAQSVTCTLVDAKSLAVNDYTYSPMIFEIDASTEISLKITAGTANQVYASGTIEELA